jgi:hypothetical protein
MAKITITGASDDLIEISGDLSEEFGCYDPNEGMAIACSDGTLLAVTYDMNGIWRFARLASGTATFSKTDGDADKDTFDTVTLEGDIKWVVLTSTYVRRNAHGKQVTVGS